jgi:hypothetical protein
LKSTSIRSFSSPSAVQCRSQAHSEHSPQLTPFSQHQPHGTPRFPTSPAPYRRENGLMLLKPAGWCGRNCMRPAHRDATPTRQVVASRCSPCKLGSPVVRAASHNGEVERNVIFCLGAVSFRQMLADILPLLHEMAPSLLPVTSDVARHRITETQSSQTDIPSPTGSSHDLNRLICPG